MRESLNNYIFEDDKAKFVIKKNFFNEYIISTCIIYNFKYSLFV